VQRSAVFVTSLYQWNWHTMIFLAGMTGSMAHHELVTRANKKTPVQPDRSNNNSDECMYTSFA